MRPVSRWVCPISLRRREDSFLKTLESILIVDDDPDAVFVTTRFLEHAKAFASIHSVSDGQEALDLFTNPDLQAKQGSGAFPPEVVLVDINMPRLNGFEFLEAYMKEGLSHEDPSQNPTFLILTSSAHPGDLQRAEDIPLVKGVIQKPLDLKTIEDIVNIASSSSASN